MSLWAWIEEFSAQAFAERDVERLRLVNLCWETLPLTATQPARALEALAQGRELAERLGERRWKLFFQHWTLQTLIFRTRDFVQALPLAEKAVAEVQDTQFADFPQRICLHDDLINVYLGIDPNRYAQPIKAMLTPLQAEVSADSECRLCLQSLRVDLAIAQGQWPAAFEETGRLMNMASRSLHHTANGYALLCRIAHGQRDRTGLYRWAWQADPVATAYGKKDSAAEIWMWQALASRWTGREEEAMTCYRKARTAARKLGAAPPGGFFDAWSEYHQTVGAFRRALNARRREQIAIASRGQTAAELRCLQQIIRLRTSLGQPVADELQAAWTLAQTLADPKPILAELAEFKEP